MASLIFCAHTHTEAPNTAREVVAPQPPTSPQPYRHPLLHVILHLLCERHLLIRNLLHHAWRCRSCVGVNRLPASGSFCSLPCCTTLGTLRVVNVLQLAHRDGARIFDGSNAHLHLCYGGTGQTTVKTHTRPPHTPHHLTLPTLKSALVTLPTTPDMPLYLPPIMDTFSPASTHQGGCTTNQHHQHHAHTSRQLFPCPQCVWQCRGGALRPSRPCWLQHRSCAKREPCPSLPSPLPCLSPAWAPHQRVIGPCTSPLTAPRESPCLAATACGLPLGPVKQQYVSAFTRPPRHSTALATHLLLQRLCRVQHAPSLHPVAHRSLDTGSGLVLTLLLPLPRSLLLSLQVFYQRRSLVQLHLQASVLPSTPSSAYSEVHEGCLRRHARNTVPEQRQPLLGSTPAARTCASPSNLACVRYCSRWYKSTRRTGRSAIALRASRTACAVV